jgi:hypothetical protein
MADGFDYDAELRLHNEHFRAVGGAMIGPSTSLGHHAAALSDGRHLRTKR